MVDYQNGTLQNQGVSKIAKYAHEANVQEKKNKYKCRGQGQTRKEKQKEARPPKKTSHVEKD
jgi:hypothetical protein